MGLGGSDTYPNGLYVVKYMDKYVKDIADTNLIANRFATHLSKMQMIVNRFAKSRSDINDLKIDLQNLGTRTRIA